MAEISLGVVLPALIGLLGTAFGFWLGHWRWSSELRMKKRAAFDAKRHDAYLELWNVVEGAHVVIRSGLPDSDQVRALQTQVNSFRLRNAIFLDSADSELANRYFNGVVDLAKRIGESGSREIEEQFEQTNTFSESDVSALQGLVKANEDTSRLREQLIERTKAVMLETSYAAKTS